MKQYRLTAIALIAAIFAEQSFSKIHASGMTSEKVRGVGLGLDVQSQGANPLPSVGLLYADFSIISYQARAAISYRPADGATYIRGGVGLGFTLVILNFDLTAQTGDQSSLGMFWGLSAFISGAAFTPEIFAGYQTNFAKNSENFFLAGIKGYLNFAELKSN
jgi:hypothetical protein